MALSPEALGDGDLPVASIGHEIRDGTDIAGDAGAGIDLRVQPDMAGDGELGAAGIERPERESEGVMGVRRRELGIDRDVAGREVVAGGGHEVSPRDGRAAMGRIRRIRADMHGTVQVQIARTGQDMGIRPGTAAAQAADAVVAMRRAGPRQLRVRQHRDAAQVHVAVLGVDVKARRTETLVELHDIGDVGKIQAAVRYAVAGEIAGERDIAAHRNAAVGLQIRIAQRQHPAGARIDGLGMDVDVVLEQDAADLGIGREARDRNGIVDIMAKAERRGGDATSPWPLLTCSRMALPSRCARARAVTALVPELTAWALTVRSALLTRFSVLPAATSREASAATLAAATPPRALAWTSTSPAKLTLRMASMSPWAMAEPASVRLPFSWAVIATEFRKVTDPPASTESWALAFTLGDSAPLPAA